MENISDQTTLIPLQVAARLLYQRSGQRPSTRTLRRWISQGRLGVRLKAVRLGCTWWTRPEWVERFQRDLEIFTQPPPPAAGPSRLQAALDFLAAHGVHMRTAKDGINSY